MGDAVELGRLIRESRLKQGMSLGQLASAVGRSSSSVRRWERGEVPPAKSIIPDLAAALDIEEAELDRLRPGPQTAAADIDDGDDDQSGTGPSTLEQPAVAVAVGESALDAPVDDSSVTMQRSNGRSGGMVGDVVAAFRSATEDWSGWIRGGLTVLVMVLMALLLVWALGELFGALGEVWDSFDAESGR